MMHVVRHTVVVLPVFVVVFVFDLFLQFVRGLDFAQPTLSVCTLFRSVDHVDSELELITEGSIDVV